MIDLRFDEPHALWLLAGPTALLLLWTWRRLRRQRDLARIRARRTLPVRERFHGAGDLSFWLCTIAALMLLILALARPVAWASVPQRPGLDVIVLQDGSASMRVNDVTRASADGRPIRDRWQQSMRFLRELGDALSWTDDRLGLVVFAHVATPQIRLTRDPNTLFFFLDHLDVRPPFRLEDDTTWDTNLEQAVAWGLRIVEKDEEIHGRSRNGAVFVMVSDGETWSGEVARAVSRAVERGIPLYVVGAGTLGGGPLPTVRTASGEVIRTPGVSRLERAALQRIAAAGRGRYFELDRDGGRYIANTIVADGRRLAPALGLQEAVEDRYWWFIAAAAAVAALGLLFVRRRGELGVLLAGSIAGTLLLLGPLFS